MLALNTLMQRPNGIGLVGTMRKQGKNMLIGQRVTRRAAVVASAIFVMFVSNAAIADGEPERTEADSSVGITYLRIGVSLGPDHYYTGDLAYALSMETFVPLENFPAHLWIPVVAGIDDIAPSTASFGGVEGETTESHHLSTTTGGVGLGLAYMDDGTVGLCGGASLLLGSSFTEHHTYNYTYDESGNETPLSSTVTSTTDWGVGGAAFFGVKADFGPFSTSLEVVGIHLWAGGGGLAVYGGRLTLGAAL